MRSTKEHSAVLICVIFLAAFAIRFWGIADDRWYRADDSIIVSAATHYTAHGDFYPDDWLHPPFKYYVLQASMAVFGDNAYGWRMKNILLGSMTVVAVFLLARALFPNPRVAVLSGLFLTIEPLHIMYSSTIFEEVSATFFFVLAVTFFIRHAKKEIASPMPAGIFLGLAFAHKWYYLFAVLVFVVFALINNYRDGNPGRYGILQVVSAYAGIPLCIYLLTYYAWMKNGHSIAEFIQMQGDVYRLQQTLDFDMFVDRFYRASPFHPADWFIKPLVYGGMTTSTGVWGRGMVLMNNPLVWLLAYPAALFTAYRAAKTRNPHLVFLMVLAASLYLQFALIRRPLYLYSAIVVLPFVYTMVAYFVVSLIDVRRERPWLYPGALALSTGWGLYLYPLVTTRSVPLFLYEPLFYLGRFFL